MLGCDIIRIKIFILTTMIGMLLTSLGVTSAQNDHLTGNINQNIIPVDLTVNNIHGSLHHYTFIKAYLSDNHGKPISNKEINFKIDGDNHIYIAITNTAGYALLYYYIFQNPGTYTIKADFAGDETYSPSTSTGILTVC